MIVKESTFHMLSQNLILISFIILNLANKNYP
ncbi:rCG53360, isoform CRA_b [Rattus norvegicus]|uniref:RCG53360, isoform CRA_b n=1 Tax=Rattus norvegicus TaxID=10116 RepID=A6KUR0_RAT|nr:rCG53360, isoform CRA_b [Rattus norvegicus]